MLIKNFWETYFWVKPSETFSPNLYQRLDLDGAISWTVEHHRDSENERSDNQDLNQMNKNANLIGIW